MCANIRICICIWKATVFICICVFVYVEWNWCVGDLITFAPSNLIFVCILEVEKRTILVGLDLTHKFKKQY